MRTCLLITVCGFIYVTAEVNVCSITYTDVNYSTCPHGIKNSVKRECCPGWYSSSGDLNCATPEGYYHGRATADDDMWLYADGVQTASHSDWTTTTGVSIPDATAAIAVKAYNNGGIGGLRVYFENVIISDTTWKCTFKEYPDWKKKWFDDGSWPMAVKHDHPTSGNRPNPLDGKCHWIWTDDIWREFVFVYCRRKILLVCPRIDNCDKSVCTNKYDLTCARCEGEHGTKLGERAYIISTDRRRCNKMCSWRSDSSRCYPGKCLPASTEKQTGVSCTCSFGFSGIHCENINTKPSFHYNELRLQGDNNEYVEAPGIPTSPLVQPPVWTNLLNVQSIKYKITSDFIFKSPPCRPEYITDFKIGIIGGKIQLRKIGLRNASEEMVLKEITENCFQSYSDTKPSQKTLDCENLLNNMAALSLPFKHNEILRLTVTSTNGGFVKIYNFDSRKEKTFLYRGSSAINTITVRFDEVKPYHHCTPDTDCNKTMLSDTDGIEQPRYMLSWDGWVDDDSKIKLYDIKVYELKLKENLMEEHQIVSESNTVSKTSTLIFTTPAVYSLIFSVYDNAGNHQSARRIIIFDDSSDVTTTHTSSLTVISAEPSSSYSWQHNLNDVIIDWKDRYINERHHSHRYLAGIKDYPGLSTQYDDTVGLRTTKPVENVQGIVNYETHYTIDAEGGSTISQPTDTDFNDTGNLNQYATLTPSLNDGDTLRYFIRAYDIIQQYKEESVTVHFDSSPPIIEDLWLTKGDMLKIAVHSLKNLNDLTIEWIAFDDHSGLHTVRWKIYDNFTNDVIMHGSQHIPVQGETKSLQLCELKYSVYPRGHNCYCTPAMGCFHKHFQVKPTVTTTEGEGLLHSKNKGTHDHDYFIQIDVVNKAKLNSSLTMKITIDTSPPHDGTVHDGKYGQPEIDFQSDLELFAHWEGFFDKESGVQFYQYGFSSTCLNSDNFNLDISSTKIITQTTVTHTSWTAPTTGKYLITVIAYNRALDPSKPVCSDGVTIDTTGPTISQVYLEGARIEGGLVSHDGQIYYITSNRNIHHVTNPTPGCFSNATPTDDISLFPLEKFPNETMKISNICSEQPIPPVFLFQSYLSKHAHIYVNWTGTDKQSGIFDYEFGLSSDKSSSSAPDLLPFISTNHHPWYKGYHSQLSDGSEFYICIKATNKAGIISIQTLGPVVVHTSKPVFKGDVNVNLDGSLLKAVWLPESFTDMEHAKLVYTAAVGTSPNGQEVLHFSPLTSGGSCQLSHPPSCTVFTLDELEWNVHHQYIYYVTVRVVNIVGLYTVAISKPYIHTSRLPSEGVVFEVVLSEEETQFKISKLEDSDFQMSTSKLTARWFGFESDDLLQDIKYTVGVRTETADLTSVNVGSKTEYTFLGLNLQLHQKYVVMVTATTDAGSKTVFSDGIVIVSSNFDVRNELEVNDGPRCSSKQGIKIWQPVHYSAEKLNQNCSDDVNYQSSTSTYMVNWKISSTFQHIYPDVKWNLQVKQDHTDIWTDITGQDLITNSGVLTKTMALEFCKAYRSKMRLCIGDICSQPIYSDGVTVLTSMEVPQMRIHMISANMFDIILSFKSTEESDVCSSRYIIDRYEWSLTDYNDKGYLITTWKIVDDVHGFDQNKFQFRITLSDDVDFSECRTLAIRIFNKAGLSTILSSEIIDCSAIDPVLIIPAIVIDVLGEPVNHNFNASQRGKNIILEQNSLWTKPDVDYTPYENVISAVWPTLRHRNYTWGLIEDQSFSTITHFTRQTIIITDPCSHPSVIICGTTETEYVNIVPTTPLSHGRRYHVCIHADSTNITHEKWTEELPEINSCSDGVTVDLSPPAGGRVWVETDGAGVYQISTNYVNVFWDSFVDVEEQGLSVHPSGISKYYMKLGSSKGGSNTFKSQSVGAVNHKTVHNITLENGHSYYVTLQAVDFVNRSTTVISEGFIVDNTPPLVTSTPIQFPKPYLTSNNIISLCWAESFRDLESGIYSYRWSIGSRPGHQDIMGYVKTADDCDEVTINTRLHDGYTYYVTVQAMNGAGLRSSLVSRPLIVDTSPPIAGHVYDIIQDRPGDDIDYISTQEDPSVRWLGFHDPHSSIKLYKVRLGTCRGCDDVMQEYEAGTHQNFTFKNIKKFHGIRYFTMVTSCNMADMCTSVSSDGFIIDVTPPIPGIILDGTGDSDIDFQSIRNYIGAKWDGFKDSESGIARYEWRVGTSKGGDELFKAEDLPVVELIYKSNIPDDNILPVGIKIYITIRAYNKVGLYSEATSNGFIVDITSPLILKKPVLSSTYYSIKPSTSISRGSIKVEWKFTDDESDIERQYVSLSPHLMGDFNSSVMEIPGVLDEYVFTNLELHDGSKYRVKLIGCNLAGLCRSATTEDILVDTSPPSRGTFAIDTYHAANLVRYPGKWIEWNTTSVTVAWLGFADLHTGITHYMISIGTKPFFTNINTEGVPLKVNHEDGFKQSDEGVIQIATIETGRELQHATSIFIVIWAFNEVGLRSEPIHSEFQLVRRDYQTDDGGSLVRRCQAYSCEGHCVCAEQDKTCSLPSGCIDISQGNNNTLIEVKDVTDLMSSEAVQANYTFSNMLLSARWNIITINGLQPIRYEVSFGEADKNEPSGIFDASVERYWFDVGQNIQSTFTFTKEKRLHENIVYSVFVRAWYDDKIYAVFKSPGITVITLVPRITNIAGSAIKEIKSARETKDIDFQTSSSEIIIYWKNKFIGGIHGLDYVKPYISTHPLGHNIHQGVDIPVRDVFYTATGLSLEQGRIYYSTVLVYNKAGLITWASSDGIVIDTTPPSSGIVHDGDGIYDKDYQSSVYLLSSSLYGFSDKDSGIVKYYWCVGKNDDNITCDVQIWNDVGLNLEINFSLALPLSSGQNIYHKVYAEDGSGLTSSVSISNGVIIDDSPPEPVDLEYIHDNIILNPSYEQIPKSETSEACDNILPVNWNADSTSCIKSVKSQPTISKDGENYIKIKGHIRQRITNLKLDSQYQAVIHVGYPHDVAVHHHMVEGFVRLGTEIYTFNLDPDLCQGMCNVDDQPIVYWYTFTYIYRPARRTEDLIIGTTRDTMILAVDDIQLREINYISINGDVNHIIYHALFKPTWSSLHLNWHFKDEESPIIHYQWALGTVTDGTQIHSFTSEGPQNHVTLSNVQLAHNTQLYLTVKATNGAGLSTVSRSESIIVDMTPPVITQINDGLGSDVKFQLTSLVSVNWKTEDAESGIDYCEWAIGTSIEQTDIQIFSPVSKNKTFVSAELKDGSKDNNVKIYCIVRCYNNAGLHVTATTNGVEIIKQMNQAYNGQLIRYKDGISQYQVDNQCHPIPDSVRLKWNTESSIDTKAVLVMLTTHGSSIDKEINLDVCYNSAQVTGLKLQPDSMYNISVSTINVLGIIDTILYQTISSISEPPTIIAGSRAQLAKSLDGKTMIITWKGVFMSQWKDIYFEVSLGTSPSGADVIQWQETKSDTITANLANGTKLMKLYLTVTAIDPCGLSTTFNSVINM